MTDTTTQLIKDPWYFDPEQKPNNRQANEFSFGRVKLFLYESLYRSVTKHDRYESFQLAKLLPKVTYLDPYVLFRFIMILVETNDIQSINKNVIFYLETLFSKLYMNKPDILLELLSYFIKHNRIEDAQELFSQRYRYMCCGFHQRLNLIDINLKCYGFIFNYLQWKHKVETSTDAPLNTDLSFQGRLVNIIDCLKTVTTNHEYFLMCLVRILMHYGYRKKAYLIISEFQNNNPNNISAQLLNLYILNELQLVPNVESDDLIPQSQVPMSVDGNIEEQNARRLKDYDNINNFSPDLDTEVILPGDYAFDLNKEAILKNLRRLDATRPELLDNINMHNNYVDILRELMDGIEFIEEISNIKRWYKLKETLDKIFNLNDEVIILDARFLWHTRYKRYWKNLNLNELISENFIYMTEEDKNLVNQIQKMVQSKLDKPIRM